MRLYDVFLIGAQRQAKVNEGRILRSVTISPVDLPYSRNHVATTIEQDNIGPDGIAVGNAVVDVFVHLYHQVLVALGRIEVVDPELVFAGVDVDVEVEVPIPVKIDEGGSFGISIDVDPSVVQLEL